MGEVVGLKTLLDAMVIGQSPITLAIMAAVCLMIIGGYAGVFFAMIRRKRLWQIAVAETAVQRALADAHCMINMIDPSGVISFANERFLNAMGYRLDEVMGKKIDDFYSDAMSPGQAAEIRAHVKKHGLWTGETELRCKNGALIWTQTTVRSASGAAGKSGSMIVLRTDITEGKRAQSDRQLRSIFDRFPDKVFVFDANTGVVLYMNQSAHRTVASKNATYLGSPFADLPGFPSSPQFAEVIAEMIAGGDTFSTFCHFEGAQAQEVSIQLIKSGDRADHIIAMARDVTKQVEIERAKSEFVSTVSHELRTPLTSIKGALSLLSAGAMGSLPERAGTILTLAQRNTDRLILLINDLLDLEKIDAGQMDFTREPLDVGKLVSDAVELNEGYALHFGVSLRVAASPRFAMIAGNRDRLAQVLTNLISNAVKFSPRGGEVVISVVDQPDGYRVSVSDQGPGIPDELIPRIFERFTQGKQNSERGFSGTGLGLSICKAIVDRHDGLISFQTSSSTGTVFNFVLPKLRFASAA